ncbi:MAG: esterase/lipase [Rhodospirillales bacterium]|nr:esterase/lipase [Rhodospirillales bacterium]
MLREMVMMCAPIYRGMTREELDRAYDNRGHVPDSAAWLARWAEASAELYRTTAAHRDLHYGADPRQRLDFFPAHSPGRPTVFFIHGGYWQWCDKEGEAFVARGPLAHDINVAVVEYTLCPQISLGGMVAEIHAALDWLIPLLPELGADPAMLVVAGSSAGAHLAAMVAGRVDVKGTLLVSGLYELEPIRLSRLNAALQLDVMTSMHNSPILNLPARAGPACFAVGQDELPEMLRQTADYLDAWVGSGLPGWQATLDGVDHFSIMDELAEPDGRLTSALVRLCQPGLCP